MDTTNITQFLTPDSVNLFKDLIMSGAIVMMITQGTKGFVDSIFNRIKFIKTPSTSGYVGFLSLVQAIFFMFVFNSFDVNLTNIYLTIINSCLLYFGCTKSFEFVFQKVSFGGKTANKNVTNDTNLQSETNAEDK